MTTIERKWLPAEWLDELPPASAPSADDFLKRDAEGVLRLTPVDRTADDEAEGLVPAPVTDGEVIEFVWHEVYGDRLLTILPDGGWTINEAFPDTANCFSTGAWWDDLSHNIDDLVAWIRENAAVESIDISRPVEISGWCWSEAEKMRVEVLESGAAHFVPVQ